MRQIVLVCTFCYYSLVTNKQKAGTSPDQSLVSCFLHQHRKTYVLLDYDILIRRRKQYSYASFLIINFFIYYY